MSDFLDAYRKAGATEGPDNSIADPRDSWPEPMDETSFHGLAGEVVRAIEPHWKRTPRLCSSSF